MAGMMVRAAQYLRTPSTSGFSPYRTGWAAHAAFSATVAAALYELAARGLGLSMPAALGLGLAGVWLLWGVGVRVGIASHSSLLLTAGPLVLFLVAAFWWPPLLLGFAVAVVGHLLMRPVGALLDWRGRRS